MNLKKAGKIIGIIIGGIVALALAVILLFVIVKNIGKHFVYKEYYSIYEKEGHIPGLNAGFVPQGFTYNTDSNTFIIAGYMGNGKPSRIYVTQPKSRKSVHFEMTSGGQPFFGHTGGIQYCDGKLYLANEGIGVFEFDASLADKSNASGKVEIGQPISVNNHSSFVFSDDKYIYVGEFNNSKEYTCENVITFNGVTHKAIVSKYAKGNLGKPLAVYSIPDLAQGVCFTADGTMMISTSYGVNPSHFLIYKPDAVIDTKQTYDGAPLFFADVPSKDLMAPQMSEDLDLVDGKPATVTESACNKYFFGKLYFANKIYSMDIGKLN